MTDFFAKAVKPTDVFRIVMTEDPTQARSLKRKWAKIWNRQKWRLSAPIMQAIFIGSQAATVKQVKSIIRVLPSLLQGGGMGLYLGKNCKCPANHVITSIRGDVILATKQQTLHEQRYTWTMEDETTCKYAISQAGGYHNVTKFINSAQGTGKAANVRIEWMYNGLLGLLYTNINIDKDSTELLLDYTLL